MSDIVSEIGSFTTHRADYTTEYIRDIINDITKLQIELNKIKHIIHLDEESNLSPTILLKEFETLTKLDYTMSKLIGKSVWIRKRIKHLEQELLNEESNVN